MPEFTCKVTYSKMSKWGGAASHYKVDGVVTQNGQQVYKIHGNWNSKIFVTKVVNNKPDLSTEECVFAAKLLPFLATEFCSTHRHQKET